jgi:hypothetical protein
LAMSGWQLKGYFPPISLITNGTHYYDKTYCRYY